MRNRLRLSMSWSFFSWLLVGGLILSQFFTFFSFRPVASAQASESPIEWVGGDSAASPGGQAESVQPRPLWAATPSVTLVDMPMEVMIGENFTFTVSFDNTASSDIGYGPFIDVVFPLNGEDGDPYADPAEAQDGIDFNETLGATYLGSKLECVVKTFNRNGRARHPYARDTSGDYVVVEGDPGDKFVSCKLPFGSFVPDQPAVNVEFNATLHEYADVGTTLPIRARGGFMYGGDPLDNWCCDAVILSPSDNDSDTWPSGDVEPTLLTVKKSYEGPEEETATGPNFERQFTVTVDIADGQTVTELDVTDELPDTLQFVQVISTKVRGSDETTTDISTPSTSMPGGTLTRRFDSVTGTDAENDATMTFRFYVPRDDASGAEVLDLATGAFVTSDNEAEAKYDWTPTDGRDSVVTGATGVCPSPCFGLSDQSIAIQKDAVVEGGGDAKPGAVIEYTLDFQISDFFAFDDIVITDTISDGQRFDDSFTPTLSVTEHGVTADGDMNTFDVNNDVKEYWTGGTPGPSAPAPYDDGVTQLLFDISEELNDRVSDDQLLGGCVPDVGTGDVATLPDCNTTNNGATTGVLVFRTVIQEEFTDDYPSGDPSVDQGDKLTDEVEITGTVLNYHDLSTTGNTPIDDSSASKTVPRDEPSKSFYAINGDTDLSSYEDANGDLHIKPGDELTYQLSYDLATSDVEDLYLLDYLPLPVLSVDDHNADGTGGDSWSFTGKCSGSIPDSGQACFGDADTFYDYSAITPALTPDSVPNTLKFDYGDYDDSRNEAKTIEILFTITVNTDPFADGLYLTNQLRVHEGSTNSGTQAQDGIIDFILDEPYLVNKKGVVAMDNPNASYSPNPPGPVTFSDPGSAAPRWTGTINSDGLDSDPIDSDISGVDGGDWVSFAIVIENQGNSQNGAFDIKIRDTLPSIFLDPDTNGGLNLSVYRGDGTAVSYTPLGPDNNGTDLFDNGIEIDDPGSNQGACQKADDTSGTNILVIVGL